MTRTGIGVALVMLITGGAALLRPAAARAQAATTPGAVTTPSPTTQGIAIEWAISGDDNANGVVTVRFREQGATAWRTGMPLLRVPAGKNTSGTFGSGGGQWGNKHAGSLFDLDPGKTYEIELTLADPDGGSMTTTTTATTRPIPAAAVNATTKNVTPASFTAALAGAQPGDILLLGAGSYPSFTVAGSGTAGQPIVIRGESVDAVTVGGRVTMSDQQWVYLENLTVMGEVRMNGASNMVVRGCKIRTTAGGITFEMGNGVPRNNFVVDNDVVGGATWVDAQLSSNGYDGGEGIQFTGSGHVVCFNHVKDFRDDISLMEYDEAYEQVSIDICNNDIEEATDDAVEADSAMGNVRVFRNRVANCFDGLSSQPDLGGPTYFVRNVMYNVLYTPFKLHNGTVGDVILHNTVVKCGDAFGVYAGETWSRALVRNNVFIGGTGGGTYGGFGNGSGRIFDLFDADTTCSFDYDGVGSIGTNMFQGRIGAATFNSLATLQANTTEAHATAVDMTIFASGAALPSNPYPPKATVDLRLAAGAAAVDKGVVIAAINDGYAGAAPDLGAYELASPLPTYGPRSTGAGGIAGHDGGAGGAGGAAGSTGGTGGGVDATGSAGTTGGATTTGGGGGCGCRTAGDSDSAPWFVLLAILGCGAARPRAARSPGRGRAASARAAARERDGRGWSGTGRSGPCT